MFGKVKDYFIGAGKEFRSIKWPTPLDTRKLTITVIVMSLGVALFLGVFDYAFQYIITYIISV